MSASIKKAAPAFKLALFSGSLIGTLVVVEIFLRLLGFYISDLRVNLDQQDGLATSVGHIDKTILAVGDSFTYGGNVQMRDSFPYQLNKLIQNDKTNTANYKLVNSGRCEANSAQIKDIFFHFFEQYTPDIVLLLAGSADSYNVEGSSINTEDLDNIFMNRKGLGFFANLRLVQLFEVLRINYLVKGIFHKFIPAPTAISVDEKTYLANIEALIELSASLEKGNLIVAERAFEKLQSPPIRKLSFKDFITEDAIVNDEQKNSDLRNLIHMPIYHLSSQGRYEEAIELSLKILERIPVRRFLGYEGFYLQRLGLLHQFQQKYTPEQIGGRLLEIYSKRPGYFDKELFEQYHQTFINTGSFQNKLRVAKRKNLEKIIEHSLKNKARVIIHNYPGSLHHANEDLEFLAKKYDLEFVDHYSDIQKLVAREGKSKYFEDDEHSTPLTYKIMANNLWKQLKTSRND